MHVQSTSSSPEALRQARHIVGHPEDYAHRNPVVYGNAWARLKAARGHTLNRDRLAPAFLTGDEPHAPETAHAASGHNRSATGPMSQACLHRLRIHVAILNGNRQDGGDVA